MSVEDLRVSAATEETAAEHFRSDIAEEIALSQNDGDEETRAVELAQATPTGDRLPPANPAPQPAAAATTDNRMTPDAANIVRLAATVSIDDIRIEGADLVLVQADGTEIVIVNGATRVPTILLGDVELPQQTFIAALEGNGINVAAGPDGSYSASSAPGSSGGDFDDSINASQNGPIALADLLGDTSFDDEAASGAQETGKDVPVAFATAFGPVLSEAADANGVFERSTFTGQLTFNGGSQQGRVTSVALNTELTTALTSGGVAIVTEMTTGGDAANPTVILTGRAGGETVFVLEITNTLTGEFTFTLLKALDHSGAGATGAADLLGLQFTYTVTDNDGDPSSSSFSIQIADDGPSTVAVAQSSVHDEALGGGNADITAATATLSNVQLNIDWGADSANNTSANDRSLVFTNANVAVAGAFGAALTSFGVAVSTIVLADGTLVGYTGAAPSSITAENVVFHATLSDAGNGSYSFTLVKPLDHAAGNGENTLTLTFSYTATDSDGDTAANTFVVNVVDDAPIANVGTEATVEDEAFSDGNNETDDNLSATSGGILNINWGSDSANLGGSNDRSVAFTNAAVSVVGAYGAGLTSRGVAVNTIVLADGTLIGYTGDAPAPQSIADDRVVFHATLSDAARGSYSFTLVQPLDHAAGDGTTGEASLSLTFGYTATDSDGDKASSQFTVRVADDKLEFFTPEEDVSISEDDLPKNVDEGGSENPETETPEDGGSDDNVPMPLRLLAVSSENPITGGSLGIRWGADNANGQGNVGLTEDGTNDRGVGFTQDDLDGLYDQALTSDGIDLVYVLSDNGAVLTAYKGSESGEAVFTVRLSDESVNGSYTFELQGNLDHTPRLGDASFGIRFDFTARDSDGDVGGSSFTVRVEDDNPVIGAPETTSLDEETVPGLNGNAGDTYADGEGSEGPAGRNVAAGSVTGSLGVSWGADDNNTGDMQRSLSFDGYGAVTQNGVTVYQSVSIDSEVPLTAAGQDVFYYSTVINGVPTLVGFTGSNPLTEANWVFTVTLDDTAENGAYTFTLLKAIDHREGNAEDSVRFDFRFIAEDSDGDVADGTFSVNVNDDAPVRGEEVSGFADDDGLDGGPASAAVAEGDLNIRWGSDSADNEEITSGPGNRSVVFVGKDIGVDGAYGDTGLTSLGKAVTTAVINGVLTGYTGDVATAETIVFTVSLSDDGTGSYRFELAQPLDHAAGNGKDALSLTFDYKATDSDGDAITGQFTVSVADDVAMIGTPFAGGIVEEEQREVAGDGNEDIGRGGDDLDADGFGGFLGLQFRDRTTHVAGGTLSISWGADNANDQGGQPGDRSVQFTNDGLVDLKNQDLTSDGKEISYTVITVNGQPTLIAYTGSVAPTTVPSNANDAISAHIVFTVALSDAASGSYKFTLFDTLDHQGSVQGEDALALTFEFTATDSDGDVTEAKSFDVQVIDDTPIAIGTILDRYVEEEALAGGNPDSGPAGAETAGSIANGLKPVSDKTGGPLNIAWGGDDGNKNINGGFTGTQVAGDRSVVFATANSVTGVVNASQFLTVKSGNSTLDVSTLTSAGKLLVFTLSDNGTILTARAGANGDVVFTVTLSDTGSGSYSFDLDGVLDHPVKASGAANEDVLSFTFKFAARDGDGDIATNNFTVKVIDDSPIAQTGTSSSVEDEAVNGGNDEQDGLSAKVENVLLNIKWGADSADVETITAGPGNRSVAFTSKTVVVSDAAGTALTSNGLAVNTTLVNGVLIGHTGTAPTENNVVFRVSLSDDGVGSYSFTLVKPLDHAAGGGENALTLTFGYTATDSDGDTSSNTFTVRVVDDVPIAGNAGDRYVEEEALRGGNEDASPIGVELAGVIANGGLITDRTGASLNIKWGSDNGNSNVNGGYTGTQVAGDRSIVFEIDASGPVPLRSNVVAPPTVNVGDLAQILTVKSGDTVIALADLKSGGQSLTYTLTDNGTKLTATAGGTTIFVVTLSDLDKGSYAFQLKGVLDHPVKAVGASNEDVLTFNFTYTARDGDGDAVTGNFAVNVIDDSPVQAWWPTTNLTLNEDDLRPNGNDTQPESLSASGNLNVSFGADGGKFELSAANAVWNAATRTLADQDGVWKITVAADGRYTYTLLDNTLAHGPADNGDNTLTINVTFKATDGDGDSVSGDFNIRIVDDVPVATDATISGTVDEAGLSDADLTALPTAIGDLSSLVSLGADGLGKYMVEMKDLSSSLTSLTSNGVAISYSLEANMLVAKAGAATIFTFKVDETTGAYTFTQQGPIDHVPSYLLDGKAVAAASIDDRGEKVTVDAVGGASLAYVGRTADGDVIIRVTNTRNSAVNWTLDQNGSNADYSLRIAAGKTVYINVGPIANGTVFDLDGANSPATEIRIGNKPIQVVNDTSLTLDLSTAVTVSDGDGDTVALSGKLNVTIIDTAPTMAPVNSTVFEDGAKTKTESLGIDWKSDIGSLKTLAIGGLVGVQTQSGAVQDKLTSNGNPITVIMIGAVLVGYIGSVEPLSASAASVVFTATVDVATGNYTFNLIQPLDHVSPSGGEQYLALTFQAIATDADGDVAKANFTVKVDAAGVLGSIDYSALNTGVFVNLDDTAKTVLGQTVLADNATDRTGANVVGIDAMAGINDAKGGSANDILIGGAEDNRLTGNAGNDYLDGGLGADILDGGEGDDRFILRADVTGSGKRLIEINGALVEVSIDGLAGTSDHVIGGLGNDVIELQRGDKAGYVADYRSAPDYISGVEKIIGTDGNDVILLAPGTVADGGRITIEGGDGNDVIGGSNSGDTLLGGIGNDLISGLDGDDIIEGGDGDDTIWGGLGADNVKGGAGDDMINLEVDRVYAGDTTSTITLADGKSVNVGIAGKAGTFDTVDGGTGSDTIILRGGSQGFVLDGNQTTIRGVEKIVGTDGDDIIVMKSDYSSDSAAGRTTIEGGIGNDTLVGGAGNDLLYGGEGDDTLAGGDGADSLFGGTGNDQFWGGKGSDSLFGNGNSNAGFDLNVSESEADTANYAGSSVNYRVVWNPSLQGSGMGLWQVEALAGAPEHMSGGAISNTDNLYGIELIKFANGLVLDLRMPIQLYDGSNLIGTFTTIADANKAAVAGNRIELVGDVGGQSAEITKNDLTIVGDSVDGSNEDIVLTLNGVSKITLKGDAPIDVIGDAGSNEITGNDGDNKLEGGDGSDVLRGGAGDDYLDGGAGADRLSGGSGINTMIGGSGSDQFFAGGGTDTIWGNELGEKGATAGENDAVIYYYARSNSVITRLADGGWQVVNSLNGETDKIYAIETISFNGVLIDLRMPVQLFDGEVLIGTFTTIADANTAAVAGNRIELVGDVSGQMAEITKNNLTILGDADGGINHDIVLTLNGVAKITLLGDAPIDVIGDAGSNDITGNDGDNKLEGGDGSDALRGGAGDDYLDGGAGDDRLSGGSGINTMIGGSGNDQFFAGGGTDTIWGNGVGDKGVTASENDAVIYYIARSNYTIARLTGGGWTVTNGLNGETDTVYGIETISFTAGGSTVLIDLRMPVQLFDGETLIGTFTTIADANTAAVAGNRIELVGDVGGQAAEITKNDLTIVGDSVDGSNEDIVLTLNGVSKITLKGDAPIDVIGDAGNNEIIGNDGANVITTGKGSDTIFGGKGNDTFIVNADIDDAIGEGKRNVTLGDGTTRQIDIGHRSGEGDGLDGGEGTDTVQFVAAEGANGFIFDRANYGGSLANVERFIGTAGDDMILLPGTYNAATGRLFIDGGAGDDVLQGSNTQGDEILGGNGNDLISGLGGDDILRGGNGNDEIWGGDGDDLISGDWGKDTLYGNEGNDTIYGGGDDDYIEGNGGNDKLYGDDGNDTIVGGKGDDVMYGGAGNDTFIHTVGDGNDIVDGGSETGSSHPDYDVLTINGVASKTEFTLGKVTGGSEIVPVSENKTDIQVSYAGGSVRADEIERVVFNLGAAGDTVSVGDLTGTAIAPTTVVINGGAGDDVIDLTGLAGTRVEITDNGGSDTVRLAGLWTDYVFTAQNGIYSVSKNGTVIATSTSVEKFAFTGTDTMPGYTVAVEKLVNVAPVAGDDTGAVVEAGGVNNTDVGSATATGLLLDNDKDGNVETGDKSVDTMTLVDVAGTAFTTARSIEINGVYGKLIVTAAGGYTYTLDNSRAATQELTQGQKVTEEFSYTIRDHAGLTDTGKLTVTVTGTNDAPVVIGGASASYVEPGILPGSGNANGAKLFLDLGITVSDIEDDKFSKVEVSVTDFAPGDTVHLFGTADRLLESGTVILVTNQAGQTNTAGNMITLTNASGGMLTAAEIKEALSLILFKTGDRVPTNSPDRVVSFVAYDENGAASASHNVTIDITGQNDAPVWHSGALSIIMSEDTSINLASDYASAQLTERPTDTRLTPTDGDDEGDARLTLSVVHGTITIDEEMAQSLGIRIVSGNGTREVVVEGPMDPGLDDLLISSNNKLSGVTYKPDANFHGNDELKLTINDLGDGYGIGNAGEATKIIAITVTSVEDAPTVETVPAQVSTLEDTSVVLTGIVVADGDGTSEIPTITLTASHGTLVYAGGALPNPATYSNFTIAQINEMIVSGSLKFVPEENFSGTAQVTVAVTQNGSTPDVKTFDIEVTSVNDAPVAFADTYVTNEDTPLIVTSANGVLANDRDVEGDPLAAVLVTGPAHGSLTLNVDGSFSYRPDANYAGPDSFTYKANDGALNSNVVTVNLSVAAVNDGSATVTVTDTTQTVTAPKVGDVLQAALGADPDGAASGVAYQWLRNGNVITNADKASYTLTDGDVGAKISVKVTYTDGQNFAEQVKSDETRTVIVNNVAPNAGSDIVVTNQTVVKIPAWVLLLNDTDADGNSLSVAGVAGASGGDASYGNQVVTFDDSDFPGWFGSNAGGSLTYTVFDGTTTTNGNVTVVGDYQSIFNPFNFDLDGSSASEILIDGDDGTRIFGNGGNDVILGNGGDDQLYGGAGADRLYGGAGNDILFGDNDDIVLDGGAGYNILKLDANFTAKGDDQIVGIKEVDLTSAAKIDLSSQTEGFVIDGSNGNDTITGSRGNDIILGGGGNDTIIGGQGNDVLFGGNGQDRLEGGAGNDVFKLRSGTGLDTIVDFTAGADKIGIHASDLGKTSIDLVTSYNKITDIAASEDNKVIRIGAAMTEAAIIGQAAQTAGFLGFDHAKSNFVLVFNSTSGKGEIWYDNDWSNTDNRTKVATLDNVTNLAQLKAIGLSDLVVYSDVTDPIILDLDHNGFAFSSLDSGVSFDINADGHKDQVAWTSTDGILAYDLDGNGRIDNGSEIFTPSFNGGGHASGIAALATLDSNGDGRIDAEDDAFSKLSIWVDANHNGVSDDGELSGLLDHSITSISLDTSATGATEDGQAVLSQGQFTLADGSSGNFVEVGFDTMFGGQPDHVVIGGDSDDILVGGAGFTQFTGGAGADTFVLDPAALQTLDMADVVTDYKAGEGDVLDVSKLLDSMLGDAPVTAEAAAASIRTTVTGNDTTVSVQVDDGWKDVAVLQNHTEAVKILFDDKHTIDVNHH